MCYMNRLYLPFCTIVGLAYIIVVLALDVIGFSMVVGSYVWMFFMVRTTKSKQNTNIKSWFAFGKYKNKEKPTRKR